MALNKNGAFEFQPAKEAKDGNKMRKRLKERYLEMVQEYNKLTDVERSQLPYSLPPGWDVPDSRSWGELQVLDSRLPGQGQNFFVNTDHSKHLAMRDQSAAVHLNPTSGANFRGLLEDGDTFFSWNTVKQNDAQLFVKGLNAGQFILSDFGKFIDYIDGKVGRFLMREVTETGPVIGYLCRAYFVSQAAGNSPEEKLTAVQAATDRQQTILRYAYLEDLYKRLKMVTMQNTLTGGGPVPVVIYEDKETIVPLAGYEWAVTDKTWQSIEVMQNFVKKKVFLDPEGGYAYNLDPQFEIDLATGELFIANIELLGVSNRPGPDGKVRSDVEARSYMVEVLEQLYQQLMVGPLTKKKEPK
jgi:hypothetical protein